MEGSCNDIVLELVDRTGEARARLRIWPIHEPSDSAANLSQLNEDPSPPRLVEATSYGYELMPRTEGVAFTGPLEPRELFEPDRAGAYRGRLRTGNRAGLLLVGVPIAEDAFASARIEVASRKLSYEHEYRWMLRDITADLAEAALARFGPSQGQYRIVDAGDVSTLYQRFAFVQAVLESDEYQEAMNQVLARPYVAWEEGQQVKSTSGGLRTSSATVRAMAAPGPRRPTAMPVGAVPGVPRRVVERTLEPSVDNLPNQYIKAILEEWRELAQVVHDELAREHRALQRPTAPVLRGLAETSRLVDELDAFLAMPLFRAVSRLSLVPGANQVLLKRPGYRELVRLHQQTQVAATLTWDGSDLVFAAGHRDVATLYEYWVFLQVGRIVAQMCSQDFDFASLFSVTESGLQLNLRKHRAQVVTGRVSVADQMLYLSLWFNRPFRRNSGESWSRDMRPDLSLGIGRTADAGTLQRVWLHFDAKYRVERLLEILGEDVDEPAEQDATVDERALRADLLKMHAYRDAIRRSSGAYVIYPGHSDDSKPDETFLEYHELLPGLGAFALRPTDQGPVAGSEGLAAFIRKVVAHAGNVLSRERRMHFWMEEVMGPPPVPPQTTPVPSRAVVDLAFLGRPPEDVAVALVRVGKFVKWYSQQGVLALRADGGLPGSMFGVRWVVIRYDDDGLVMLDLGREPRLGVAQPGIVPAGGTWLAMTGTLSGWLPGWLSVALVDEILGDNEIEILAWGKLAVRACG